MYSNLKSAKKALKSLYPYASDKDFNLMTQNSWKKTAKNGSKILEKIPHIHTSLLATLQVTDSRTSTRESFLN